MVGTGAALTGLASAQAPAPVVTVIPPAMQQPITANGGNSANSNNNYQAAMLPGNVANPTPGTFVVRLNGLVSSEFLLGGGSGFVGSGPSFVTSGGLGPGPGRPGTAVFLGTGTNAGQKLAPYSMAPTSAVFRGRRHGDQRPALRRPAEIRENFVAAQSNTANTGTSGLTSGQTLYVRRAFWYMAGDNWGLLRMGQTDGVTGIFDNGITTGQQPGQGLWNGDAPGIVAGNGPAYPVVQPAGRRIRHTQDRLPVAADSTASTSASTMRRTTATRNSAGASREPERRTCRPPSRRRAASASPTCMSPAPAIRARSGRSPCTPGAPISAAATFSIKATPWRRARWKAARRWRRAASTTASSRTSAPGSAAWPSPMPGSPSAGAWQGGQYNGVMALKPQNGVGAQAWVASIYYSNGPLGVGATYYQFDSQGAIGLTGLSQRHEDAFGVGGSYAIAPGLLGYTELLYFQRHQAGFDLNNGKYFNQVGYAGNNDVHGTAFVVGARMRW